MKRSMGEESAKTRKKRFQVSRMERTIKTRKNIRFRAANHAYGYVSRIKIDTNISTKLVTVSKIYMV